ncbi:MAG: putative nucleotide-binding protein containing TIR-like domain [Pseudomonadota bacterium]|jgi:predicted nucleotide-binding protein
MQMRDELSYAAYYGLQEVVVRPEQLEEAISERVNLVTDAAGLEFRRPNRRSISVASEPSQLYDHIRIADTFFSDTFPHTALKKLFGKAHAFRGAQGQTISIRILLLNPFSSIAAHRANAVDHDGSIHAPGRIYRRLNRGLRRILEAVAAADPALLREPLMDREEFLDRIKSMTVLRDQLKRLEVLETDGKIDLQIRFVDSYQELPFYNFGPYVFKGTTSPTRNANQNPWSIYIDDVAQKDDIFDFYCHDVFDDLWDGKGNLDNTPETVSSLVARCELEAAKSRTIFIGHGQDNEALRLVKEVVRSQGYEPLSFEDVEAELRRTSSASTIIPEIVRRAIERSMAAILLFTDPPSIHDKDREIAERAKEAALPRLNVAHELGMCQATFDERHVVVVADSLARTKLEETQILPSNEQGRLHIAIARNATGRIDENAIALSLRNKFFDNLRG